MAERLSAAQVEEWTAFERRYGPVLLHERLDIGLALVSQILAGGGPDNPLSDFLPYWWDWMNEPDEEEFYEGQADEAGQMIAAMRAMANKWAKRKEVEDAKRSGSGAGSSDQR